MQRLRVAVLLTFVTTLLLVTSANAQTTPANTFDGVWVYTGDAAEETHRVAQIEKATEEMSAFIRGVARNKLAKQTMPVPRLRLSVSTERFEVKGEDKGISLELGGEPIEVDVGDRQGKVSAKKDAADIVVVAEGQNGRRSTRYALSPDGTRLLLTIRMNGERLSAPLEYQLTYRRTGN